nr:hypothetical protein [Tanacetum cinerariifolium]
MKYVADEAVHKVLGDSLVRAATTASSLEAEQDSGHEQSLVKDAFKLGRRIDDIDVDEHITLISVHDDDDVKDLGDEPVKPKKKEQIRLDEEVALKLQAEFVEEERLARERELKNNLKPTLL